MNQDIPETYEELKQAFVAECKERYENNECSRRIIRELKFEIADLERQVEELEENVDDYECVEELLEVSSCENVEELVKDVRDNWKELKELQEQYSTLEYQYDMAIQTDNKEIACLKEEIKELREDGWREKMDEHIKFHLTEIGGEYNYIDTETGEHIFLLGKGGTLDEAVEYVEELKAEIDRLKKMFCYSAVDMK